MLCVDDGWSQVYANSGSTLDAASKMFFSGSASARANRRTRPRSSRLSQPFWYLSSDLRPQILAISPALASIGWAACLHPPKW